MIMTPFSIFMLMIYDKNFIARYIEYLDLTLRRSRRTLQEYDADLHDFIAWSAPIQTPLSIVDVTASIVTAYIDSLARRGLSAATIQRRASVVRGFYKWAFLRGFCASNPAAIIRTPRIPVRYAHCADEDAVRRFIADDSLSPSSRHLQFIVAVMYCTGMRLSEVLTLQASDFDFEQCFVRVIGKGNKQRFCAFSAASAHVLSRFVGSSTGLLFPDANEATIRWAIIASIRANGRGVNPHSIRHLYASRCVAAGMPLIVLSRQLGHASVKTTERYISMDSASLVSAVDMFAPSL